MASDVTTTLDAVVGRGAWPALGPKLGLVQIDIDLDDVAYTTTGDWFDVFTFSARTLVLAAGVYVTTAPTDTTSAIALGTGGSDVLMAAVTMSAAAVAGESSFGEAPLAFAADGVLTAAISTASCAGGAVRIWALVADIGDVTG
jgi:hypothetical protein